MARDASFLYQFVSDFWDLLPSEDKQLIAAYWHGLTQVVADLYNEAFETTLGTTVLDVQPFRTERWNRYQLSSDTADIQSKTDQITLIGTGAESLSEDAVLFETLSVSRVSGIVQFSETLSLVGESIEQLKYGNIIPETLRVFEGSAIFVPNRDYRVNIIEGRISRIETGGIPSGTTVTIRYAHSAYKRDLDYTVDEINRTVERTPASNIPSGEVVDVTFNYDATVPDAMGGRAEIDATAQTLNDDTKDFTGVLPGRTITIIDGANAGTYTVQSVQTATTLQITGAFVADDASAAYSINAFPYAITLSADVSSVPTMQDLIVDPTIIFRENVDYQVGTNKISFRVVPPETRENDGPTLWAEETFVDEQTVYRNFGVLIDFFRATSEDYLSAVRGLWYTYWTGSTHENLIRGIHILLGLPFATVDGTVSNITTQDEFILDVSAGADITPEPIRDIVADAADTITSATRIFAFPGDIGTGFTSADIGSQIRIVGSSAGNDGYYTIGKINSITAVEVMESVPSDETAGYTAELFGPLLNEIRNVPSSVTDSITSATKTFVFTNATGGDAFTSSDIGRKLQITGSVGGNNGVYTIATVPLGTTVTVAEDVDADEVAGFLATVHEPLVVDHFSYSSNTFTGEDVGRVLRISNTVSNDGDYEILEVVAQNQVRAEPFNTVDGPGGFFAEIYSINDVSIEITDADGLRLLFDVPTGLSSLVEVGDAVTQFQRLTDGVRIIDKNNTANFVELTLGRPGIQRFLTQNASTGAGASDETKALTMLLEHLFIPQVLTAATSENTNVVEIETFLENLKPQWTEYIFSFADDFTDTLTFGEDLSPSDLSLTIDLTTILSNSWPNIAQPTQVQYQGSGDILRRTLRTPATDAGDAIDIPAQLTVTNAAFTSVDVGRQLNISGSASNDGVYTVTHVLGGTQVLVTPDFAASEGTGFTVDVQARIELQDGSATFSSDAVVGDVIQISDGPNVGHYRIEQILTDTNLIVFESVFDGPFNATEVGRSFNLIASHWFLDQGAVDFTENFLHERSDGATTAATTFEVDSSVNLDTLGVQVGYLLVIKSGTNQDVYDISSVDSSIQLTISGSFPSSPAGSQDYAIAQAALVRSDSGPTILEVIPI